MAWQITYRLVRDTPLNADERDHLIRYVVRHQRQPWPEGKFELFLVKKPRKDGQLAWGTVTHETEYDLDYPRFLQAVSEMHDLIDGVELVVTDSQQRLVYKGGERHSLMIEPRSYKGSDLVDPKGLKTGWECAASLGSPDGDDISEKMRILVACAVGLRSLPALGMRDVALADEVVSLIATNTRSSVLVRDALLVVLAFLCRLENDSLVAVLSGYEALNKTGRAVVLDVLGGAVATDAVMNAVRAASKSVPKDSNLAKFVVQ